MGLTGPWSTASGARINPVPKVTIKQRELAPDPEVCVSPTQGARSHSEPSSSGQPHRVVSSSRIKESLCTHMLRPPGYTAEI